MKKIFTLFAAMLVALTASAETWNITPTQNPGWSSECCNIQTTLSNYAQAGDTIVLADGTYTETYSPAVANAVYVKAADGARPVVKMAGYFQFSAGYAKFEGISFDHTDEATNSYCFYIQQDTPKKLIIENCEFKGFNKYCFSCASGAHIDSVIVNNCYFHDLQDGAFYFSATKREDKHNFCDYLEVTNSTFANITISSWVAVIDLRNNDGSSWTGNETKLVVDHCTFYNCYGDYDRIISSYKSPNAAVSNCIFANNETPAKSNYATYFYGGNVTKCLVFNNSGHCTWNGATITGGIAEDPLFVDAENGNFMLQAGSPAIGAATDGSNLGDPFWNTRTLYLKPGVWNADGDKFAIWCFGSGSHTSQWSGFMTQVGESDIYTTTIPAGFPTIIFARIAGNAASPNWNDKHNQTANQTINDALDMCKITAWGESGKDSPCEWFKYGIALYGDMNSWSKSADLLVADGDDYKITINLTAGDYEFKLIDHGDYRANGWWFKRDATTATGISADGTNMKIVADKDGDYVITWTRATGTLSVTFPTATAIDNTVVNEKAVKVMRNGQLFIEKDGKTYNVLGTLIK